MKLNLLRHRIQTERPSAPRQVLLLVAGDRLHISRTEESRTIKHHAKLETQSWELKIVNPDSPDGLAVEMSSMPSCEPEEADNCH